MFFKSKKFLLWVGLLAFFGFGCSSGGGGGDSIPPTITPATTNQGTVSQSYVKGATVFADKIEKNSITGNFELDDDEARTTSSQTGDFSLSVPAGYGDYVICSKGGTITNSDGIEVPARPMLAPAGAENITPVTTLVALDPTLQEKLGENYDADIADPLGTSGEILQLAKTVETILDFFISNSNPIVTDITNQFAVFDHIAAAMEDTNLADDASLVTAAQNAVENILEDDDIIDNNTITLSDTKAIVDTIKNTVETIVENIDEASNITEDSILSLTEVAVQEGIDNIQDNFMTVSTKIDFIGLGTFNLFSDSTITLSENQADQIETLSFNVSGKNEFNEDKIFSNAELSLSILDANSSRELNVKLTHVEVTVATVTGYTTFALSNNSKIFMKGRNSDGDNVHTDFDNKKDGLKNVFSFDDNLITFDCEILEEKLQSTLGTDHDLVNIGLPGDYTLRLEAKHVPFVSFSAYIIVS
ncbi:MAG: hypothetical protein JW786_15125 [Desulfobacterales bacterium]|nr:hypothetical protein [Desulfobacterales bacterium]